jgi:tetratricopeptide (TPR) repeat protein
MAEEPEIDRSGAPPSPPSDVATWAALSAASRETADAFLEDQRKVAREQAGYISLQSKELAHELTLRHWSLRVRHVSDVLKLSFELGAAALVLALAAAIGSGVWSAAHDKGLIIESFDVPPDMAAKGLSGPVIASKLLDDITALQKATSSSRPASSFTNDWTNAIKVEIPDTGVSFGQAYRYLRNWLGEDMHMSGEAVETDKGIALTVRLSNESGVTFEGPRTDFDKIVHQAAEAMFKQAQPYRYAVYLAEHGRVAESGAIFHDLTEAGSPLERAWAYIGLAAIAENGDRFAEADALARRSLAEDPALPNGLIGIAESADDRSHSEDSLSDWRRAEDALRHTSSDVWNGNDVRQSVQLASIRQAELVGDYLAASAGLNGLGAVAGDFNGASNEIDLAEDIAAAHDPRAAAARLAALGPLKSSDPLGALDSGAYDPASADIAHADIAADISDWRAAAHYLDESDTLAQGVSPITREFYSNQSVLERKIAPRRALASAMLGDFRDAHGRIDATPRDCYFCLRTRGEIDATQRNFAGAAFWFARAVDAAPSIPFAYADWGALLFSEGEFDAAIAKFEAAHDKGPHFADPLEMWGEALMQKNRSDLALAKFEEANKYAPNWGRLHLKWGEALFYAGKRDDAKKQFAIAGGLELLQSEKAALAAWMKTHG